MSADIDISGLAACPVESSARDNLRITEQRSDYARWSRVQIVLFLALLGVPSLDLALKLDPNPAQTRAVVAFPEIKFNRTITEFPGHLKWYVMSNMGFRGSLVRAHGLFKRCVLGVSPAPAAVLPATPWLFCKGERVLDDYRRVAPFTNVEIEKWRSVLEERHKWLAQQGIHYLFVIAPNKETVYAEQMPQWITRVPGPSRVDQLVSCLRSKSDVTVLDLREALAAHQRDERLFHHTDTHWNDLGAFWGYRAIVLQLQQWYPQLKPLERVDFSSREEKVPGGDLARICGLQNDLYETQIRIQNPALSVQMADGSPLVWERMDVHGRPLLRTRSGHGAVRSAVIIRDSFGEALLPYLGEHFEQATWVWDYGFPKELILKERPVVVIQEIVERKLMTLVPENTPN